MKKYIIFIGFFLMLIQPLFASNVYTIDAEHSTVTFKIKHLFSWTQGTFNDFEGSITYVKDEPSQWETQATIQASSIDTNNEKRDNHLRNEDFLDVTQFPTLEFKSSGITDVVDNKAKLHGDLTLHGTTLPVALDLEINGSGPDPWGNVRAAFTATTTIDRRDYGLTWSKVMETGSLVVGNEVRITLEIEAIEQ